jgi:hypothetical protein
VEARPARWTSWDYRVAVMGYVAGNAAARAQLAPIAIELAALPPAARWDRLSKRIAATVGDRWGSREMAGRWRAADLMLRSDARWAGGYELAGRTGADRSWWGSTDETTWVRLEHRAEVRG